MFTLKQLKYFISVAEEGSIKAAAEKLFISQPGISAAVTQLEDILGIQLLVRQKSKGVELTPAGHKVLEKSKDFLRYANEFNSIGQEFSEPMKGTISIGIFNSMGSYVLPQLLAKFKQKYPQTELSIFEGDQKEIQDALNNGVIELAIMYDIGLDRDMDFKALKTLPPYIVISTTSSFANKPDLSLKDLKDEPLILLDLPYSNEYFYNIFQQSGFMPKIGYKTKSILMLRNLITHNLGYSILNYMPSKESYDSEPMLIYHPIDELDLGLNLVVSWRSCTKLSLKASAFLEVIEENLNSNSIQQIQP